MYQVGVDIGSTAAKAAVLEGSQIRTTLLVPTGFSSIDAAERVASELEQQGYCPKDCTYVATGYGRVAVPYADKVVTEITCHGKGAAYLFGPHGTVIDVGGQDTKVIVLEEGKVAKFVMNDKCSAGTGKFLEIMANRLSVSQEDLSGLAREGGGTTISSMCTVFAETEIISLISKGEPRENIAFGVVESVVEKVVTLAAQMPGDQYFLTGGLCENEYLIARLAVHLKKPIESQPLARYAGAIGAALLAPTNKEA